VEITEAAAIALTAAVLAAKAVVVRMLLKRFTVVDSPRARYRRLWPLRVTAEAVNAPQRPAPAIHQHFHLSRHVSRRHRRHHRRAAAGHRGWRGHLTALVPHVATRGCQGEVIRTGSGRRKSSWTGANRLPQAVQRHRW